REEAGPHRFHAEESRLAREGYDRAGFPAIRGERFLAQHGLPRGKGEQAVLAMERVRSRDVDDVHPGVRHELLVAAVGPWCAQGESEGLGATAVARSHRDELRVAEPVKPVRELPGHPPRAEDAPADARA